MLALTPKMIDAVLERDATCDNVHDPIKITRRRVDGHDLYFAINDSATAWDGTVRFCGDGVREQRDPATGTSKAVAEATRVPLHLGPYGAMFFRTPQVTSSAPPHENRLGRAQDDVQACRRPVSPQPAKAPTCALN